MTDWKNLGESCLGVFIAFACLSYFFVKNDHVVLRRTPPPVLGVKWDRETSKAWARICAAISICGLLAGIALIKLAHP